MPKATSCQQEMTEPSLEIGRVDISACNAKPSSEAFARAQASAPKTKKSKHWRKLQMVSHAVFVFSKSRDYKKEGDPKFDTEPFLYWIRGVLKSTQEFLVIIISILWVSIIRIVAVDNSPRLFS